MKIPRIHPDYNPTVEHLVTHGEPLSLRHRILSALANNQLIFAQPEAISLDRRFLPFGYTAFRGGFPHRTFRHGSVCMEACKRGLDALRSVLATTPAAAGRLRTTRHGAQTAAGLGRHRAPRRAPFHCEVRPLRARLAQCIRPWVGGRYVFAPSIQRPVTTAPEFENSGQPFVKPRY
jgi:hypothetical protein